MPGTCRASALSCSTPCATSFLYTRGTCTDALTSRPFVISNPMPEKIETDYVLGTNDEEIQRLGLQHRVWRPTTLECWRRGRISIGSRVIDIGCGPGYATLDLAEIVGRAEERIEHPRGGGGAPVRRAPGARARHHAARAATCSPRARRRRARSPAPGLKKPEPAKPAAPRWRRRASSRP